MVTCARSRGSMMKVLPVAALTASAICVMSASLKLAVMCCACCAEASEAAISAASAHTATERKPVTGSTPKKRAGRLLVAVAARHFGRWRRHRRLVGRRRHGHGGDRAAAAARLARQAVRFPRDLGDIPSEILLLAPANERDARLGRA